MRKIGKWFLLLNKRLYKKATFLLILLLIPALVFGYRALAQEESGVLTVALACQGEDATAQQIMEELKSQSDLIRFVICQSPADAEAMVTGQKADGAWIFDDDLDAAICRFAADPARKNAFVRILEADSSVPMKLIREKLSGVIFSRTSGAFYLSYLRENVPGLENASDQDLMQYYEDFASDAHLFDFAYLDGGLREDNADKSHYLLSPVRGLLGVVIVLGALAAAMYYTQDEAIGTFSLVAQGQKPAVEFGCQVIAVCNVSFFCWIALTLSGLGATPLRELLLLILYTIATALFAMTLRRLSGSMGALGTLLPLLVVAMLVICPVFFDLGMLRYLQYLFPPTYYINAPYSDFYLYGLLVYGAVLLGIYILAGKLLHKQ